MLLSLLPATEQQGYHTCKGDPDSLLRDIASHVRGLLACMPSQLVERESRPLKWQAHSALREG